MRTPISKTVKIVLYMSLGAYFIGVWVGWQLHDTLLLARHPW